jgi:pimeloyl-ACP methyl ester carboxylesterase
MRMTAARRITIVGCIVLAFFAAVMAPGVREPVRSILDPLKGLSDADAAEYLGSHPRAELAFLNEWPDEVATWWADLSKRERAELISTSPEFVGNLEGIDYGSRDKANRAQLRNAYARLSNYVHKNPTHVSAKGQLAALKAIYGAVKGDRSPSRQLITLTDDRPALAAVAIGDLDTANVITYNLPGMGTYTTDMQLWSQSAQNLYDQQGALGATAQRAVVAWIGYKTPPVGADAAFGSYAARGADAITTAVLGLRASRASDYSMPLVNIVAHSYGSTTAANALSATNLGIRSFVNLGSAGIDQSIPNAAAFNAKFVYAAEANGDREARWGRLSRNDPRRPNFGAQVFGVDGAPDLGLLPVTGHAPILHSPWNDDPTSAFWAKYTDPIVFQREYDEHFETYGYLDAGTESLYNVAVAVTPGATGSLIR